MPETTQESIVLDSDTTVRDVQIDELSSQSDHIESVDQKEQLEENSKDITDFHEKLLSAEQKISSLENELSMMRTNLASGEYVHRSIVEEAQAELEQSLKKQKFAEQQKRSLELELEDLTSGVFEEANKMISVIQKEKELLKSQLDDSKAIIASRENETAALKDMIHDLRSKVNKEPAQLTEKSLRLALMDYNNEHMNECSSDPSGFSITLLASMISLSFAEMSLLHNEVANKMKESIQYQEFLELLNISRVVKLQRPPVNTQTTSSFTYTGLTHRLMNYRAQRQASSSVPSPELRPGPIVKSNTALSLPLPQQLDSPSSDDGEALQLRMDAKQELTGQPALEAEQIQVSSLIYMDSLPALKDTKFGKRCIAEEIDPTLRLDSSKLTYFKRNKVHAAILDGSIIIEPRSNKGPFFQRECTICSVLPPSEENWTYGFRRSKPDAEFYLICPNCKVRLCTACELIFFLKHVIDGLWMSRTDDDDDSDNLEETTDESDKDAMENCRKVESQQKPPIELKLWEECTRLRMAMATARWGFVNST